MGVGLGSFQHVCFRCWGGRGVRFVSTPLFSFWLGQPFGGGLPVAIGSGSDSAIVLAWARAGLRPGRVPRVFLGLFLGFSWASKAFISSGLLGFLRIFVRTFLGFPMLPVPSAGGTGIAALAGVFEDEKDLAPFLPIWPFAGGGTERQCGRRRGRQCRKAVRQAVQAAEREEVRAAVRKTKKAAPRGWADRPWTLHNIMACQVG